MNEAKEREFTNAIQCLQNELRYNEAAILSLMRVSVLVIIRLSVVKSGARFRQ